MFAPIRKKFDKYSVKPSELCDYSTIDGKVNINVSSAYQDLLKDYNNIFINRYQAVFKDLEDATEEIEKNSQALSKSIEKYSDCFNRLGEIYSETGFEEFTDMYNHIRDLTHLYNN